MYPKVKVLVSYSDKNRNKSRRVTTGGREQKLGKNALIWAKNALIVVI